MEEQYKLVLNQQSQMDEMKKVMTMMQSQMEEQAKLILSLQTKKIEEQLNLEAEVDLLLSDDVIGEQLICEKTEEKDEIEEDESEDNDILEVEDKPDEEAEDKPEDEAVADEIVQEQLFTSPTEVEDDIRKLAEKFVVKLLIRFESWLRPTNLRNKMIEVEEKADEIEEDEDEEEEEDEDDEDEDEDEADEKVKADEEVEEAEKYFEYTIKNSCECIIESSYTFTQYTFTFYPETLGEDGERKHKIGYVLRKAMSTQLKCECWYISYCEEGNKRKDCYRVKAFTKDIPTEGWECLVEKCECCGDRLDNKSPIVTRKQDKPEANEIEEVKAVEEYEPQTYRVCGHSLPYLNGLYYRKYNWNDAPLYEKPYGYSGKFVLRRDKNIRGWCITDSDNVVYWWSSTYSKLPEDGKEITFKSILWQNNIEVQR
jgi:hypothetical protein